MLANGTVDEGIETNHQLWDWAGVDGLQLAQSLFGDAVRKIAPFQSLDTTLNGSPCSVLRLCEGNFRVAIAPTAAVEAIIRGRDGLRIWVKRCDTMGAIVLPESPGLTLLPQIATTKPIYRLDTLHPNCAAPARIDGMAVLVWRHSWSYQPIVELQVAQRHLTAVKAKLSTL
ncbi:hypothetical protein IQ268_30500 [Oculatella sp. LEGE 06141]|nr:hypothetical protein [Oculatella sp. LEGE 06141]MBE9182869.1 hypothetical protein [Oculatella sp. LEGE 06141]